jgi:hypothetical protein
MTITLENRRQFILQKQEILNQARTTLKQEFIGIDNIIDNVHDAVSSWYLFPDMLEKPIVINLWGLTGVGKSALVKRIAQLLHFEEKFFPFDLGDESSKSWMIKTQLENLTNDVSGIPLILAFDEFQHARTLDDSGAEIDTKSLSLVWQLMDNGKIHVLRNNYRNTEVYLMIQQLSYLLENGVRVENGKVIQGHKLFLEVMDGYKIEKKTQSDSPEISFIPKNFQYDLYEMGRGRFSSELELVNTFSTLSGGQIIDLLTELHSMALSPKILDCSKGLIFVLGNLDEAYTMNGNLNADMDPDIFHEASLEITVPIIKKALQKRFRSEQIARLGNTHIIFPAFSKSTFQRIIRLELDKIALKIESHYNIEVDFHESIEELIYTEGVYPTQGARPLLTTIHQTINTKLGRVFSELILSGLTATSIQFIAKDEAIQIVFIEKDKQLHSIDIPQPLILGELRKSKQNDLQSIVAVHESGHAILSAVLLGKLPEVIYSNSVSADIGGFVHLKENSTFIYRKEIMHRIAVLLGGKAAEHIVFGEEYSTSGSKSDVLAATELVTKMYKEYGMGSIPGAYNAESTRSNEYLYDHDGIINMNAEVYLNTAITLAIDTLTNYETLLLRMADHLSDHRRLTKSEILEMIKIHTPKFDTSKLAENKDLVYYRNHLKQKIKELDEKSVQTNHNNHQLTKNHTTLI